MTGRHLGQLVAELADGHLDGTAREQALAHVAACAECRREVGAHREMRARLATLSAPAPPVSVVSSLLSLAPGGRSTTPSPAGVAATTRHVPTSAIPLARPAGRAFGAQRISHRRRLVAAGVLAAATVGGGATLGIRAGGGTGGAGPVVTPGNLELLRYTLTSRSVVEDDPAPLIAASLRP